MSSLNRVFIIGRIGHDPELKMSKSGKPYTRLNVATNRFRPADKAVGDPPKPDWHSVFVWGEQAERCVQFLRRGAMVYVEGSLSYWQVAAEASESTRGEKQGYKNAVHANSVKFITYGGKAVDRALDLENLDIPPGPRNHNAVAHPGM